MIIPLHNDLSEHVLRPSSGNAFELTVEQLATAIRLGAAPASAAGGPALPQARAYFIAGIAAH